MVFETFTAQVEEYLRKNGWLDQNGTWKTEWEDEGVYLHLPPVSHDMFASNMLHALQVVANLELRDVQNVIDDITGVQNSAVQ